MTRLDELKKIFSVPLIDIGTEDLILGFIDFSLFGLFDDAELVLDEISKRDSLSVQIYIESESFIVYLISRLNISNYRGSFFGLDASLVTELFKRHSPIFQRLHYPDANSVVLASAEPLEFISGPYKRRRIDCFIREFWWPGSPETRKHELSFKIPNAFELGGWQSRFIAADRKLNDVLAAVDDSSHCDVALVDGQILFWNSQFHEAVADAIFTRYESVVLLLPDCWTADLGMLREIWGRADLVWTAGTEKNSDMLSDIGVPVSSFPLPLGVNHASRNLIRSSEVETSVPYFKGSIEYNNWPRLFYFLLSINSGGRSFRYDVSGQGADGLDAETSYYKYLLKLARNQNIVSLCGRSDGQKTLVSRPLEVMSIGRTLITENCDTLSRLFVSGEHFVGFDGFAGFCSAVEAVIRDPGRAKKIADDGCKFIADRYGEDQLVRHFCGYF